MAKAASRDGLFKRGRSPFWQCWVRGRRYSTRCVDRQAARLVKAKLERAAADPAYLAAHEATVGGAVRDFLANYATRGKAAGTVSMYRTKCGHLTRVLGASSKLATVQAQRVDAFVETRLSEGAQRATIGKELTALRQVLRFAKRHGAYPFDLEAIMPIGFSLQYKPKTRALTLTELDALVEAVAEYSPAHAAAVVFTVAVAPRKSEMERAHSRDIDWTRWVVRVHGTKTATSSDEVPVWRVFRPLFERWVRPLRGQLFGVWHNMTRDLAAACVRAELERVTANDLRRSTASILRASGATTDVVARVLRHVDSRMVERVYGRISADDIGAVLDRQTDHQQHTGPIASEKPGCPGTESNRRHEDFQADLSRYEGPVSGAFMARVPGQSGYDAARLATIYSALAGGA